VFSPVEEKELEDIIIRVLTKLSEGPMGDVELELESDSPIVLDNIGLLDAADFFGDIANLVAHIDVELDGLDYQIGTANAYVLLASLIEYGINGGYIEDKGWTDIAERFLVRAQDFAGVKDYMSLGDIWSNKAELARILDYLMHNWDIKTEMYSANGFTNDERVQMIRSTIIGLRNKGWLDYSQPWARRFIAALKEDWVHFGGGFGANMGSGSTPWSHG
jgi:hypothetical protein